MVLIFFVWVDTDKLMPGGPKVSVLVSGLEARI